jgi:hypothetical protein
MTMEAIETFEVRGLTVKIFPDYDPESPRKDRDNLAECVAFPVLSQNYDIADRESTGMEDDALDRRGFALVSRYLRMFEGAETLPFHFQDYGSGGASVFAGDVSDENPSGFFVVTRDRIVREYGNDSAESRKLAQQVMEGELTELRQYAEGDIYGYVVEDAEGETLDSCWNFYGFDYAKEEARNAAECAADEIATTQRLWAFGNVAEEMEDAAARYFESPTVLSELY